MICCLVALTLHSAHPRQVAFNVQQMLTAYARDVRGAMKPRLHSDLNRDSGYKTVEPNDDIIEERLPGRARRGTEAAPMETRGLDPVPETQSEQDDPSIMTGDAFWVHTNTLHWYLNEVMLYNLGDWILEQNKNLVLLQISNLLRSHREKPLAGGSRDLTWSYSLCVSSIHWRCSCLAMFGTCQMVY